MEIKATMRAIRTGTSRGHAEQLEDVPIPSLTTLAQHPAHVLLKPSYVGINPCDYLFVDREIMFTPGMTIGCEYAGGVIEVGSAVTSGLKKGDRITGLSIPSAGPMPNTGSFAEDIGPHSPSGCKRIENGTVQELFDRA